VGSQETPYNTGVVAVDQQQQNEQRNHQSRQRSRRVQVQQGHGWQVIVECMNDEEIMEHLNFMLENELMEEITVESAIKEFTAFAEINTERHDEIASTAW